MNAIFIGGSGRSGTTMLADLLGVNGRCLATPDTPFKNWLIADYGSRPIDDLDAALARIAKHGKYRELGLRLDLRDPDLLGAGWRELMNHIVHKYADSIERSSFAIWVDPANTNLQFASELLTAYPAAHFIHIVRDGRAVAASVMDLDWGPNQIHRCARDWMECLAHGLAIEQRWPDRALRVRYEDILRDAERELRRICDHCDLEFLPAMCRGGGLRVPGYTKEQHKLVGKPPEPLRIDAWKSRLSPRHVEIFESEVGQLLPVLGYEPVYGAKARGMTTLEEITLELRDIVRSRLVNTRKKTARMHSDG